MASSVSIVKVPSVEVLRQQIKQIRDYQNLMDRMDEVDDDLPYQSSVVPGNLVADALPLPLPMSSPNGQSTQGVASLITPNVLVLDVPRSIYQSIRTFNNWLDRIFGLGWRQARM